MRAKESAPAHMVQGSSVTNRSQSRRRSEPIAAAAWRIASISACAVGSRSVSVRLRVRARISSPRTMTQPTGTSPAAAAARASASAKSMKEPAMKEPAMKEFATLVLAVKLCYPRMLIDPPPQGKRPRSSAMTRKRDDRRSKPAKHTGAPAPAGADANHPGDRIAKVMARAGLCSRRDAEDWIAAGRVAVNGKPITSPAVNISGRDRVTIDGKPMPRRERTRLFLYNKPAGLVTTNADPQGRPTVFDALPPELPRLMSVGRLDIGTEGLLLLTNDGGLARVLELPDTQWLRRYRVRAHGRVTQAELDRLRDGISIEGVNYGPIEATLDREQGANVWLSFAIREGKNREVRNVLGHLGLQVNRLIRVAFGPFELGELRDGAIEEVETALLRERLGEDIVR